MPQCYDFNYQLNQSQLLPNVWVPCPVGDNCCIGIDTCLSNNLCKAYSGGKNKRTGTYSGYYNARCTDPTYTNPACDKICVNSPPDVVYNYTSHEWACCGNNTAGEVTCSNPLQEYYDAPAPALLATLSIGAYFVSTATLTPIGVSTRAAVTSSSSASVTNSSSTASVTSASSTTASSAATQVSTSSGLSSGAKAGIGVGVTVVVLLIIVGIILILRRKRTAMQYEPTPQEIDSVHTKPMQEMPVNTNYAPIEIDSTNSTVSRLELDHLSTPPDQFSFQRGQSMHLTHNRGDS